MFLAPCSRSRSRSKKKNEEPEPEPPGKKSGAGAAKKLAALQPCEKKKKHKEIVLLVTLL